MVLSRGASCERAARKEKAPLRGSQQLQGLTLPMGMLRALEVVVVTGDGHTEIGFCIMTLSVLGEMRPGTGQLQMVVTMGATVGATVGETIMGIVGATVVLMPLTMGDIVGETVGIMGNGVGVGNTKIGATVGKNACAKNSNGHLGMGLRMI